MSRFFKHRESFEEYETRLAKKASGKMHPTIAGYDAEGYRALLSLDARKRLNEREKGTRR